MYPELTRNIYTVIALHSVFTKSGNSPNLPCCTIPCVAASDAVMCGARDGRISSSISHSAARVWCDDHHSHTGIWEEERSEMAQDMDKEMQKCLVVVRQCQQREKDNFLKLSRQAQNLRPSSNPVEKHKRKLRSLKNR